jgi:hypothetical protein
VKLPEELWTPVLQNFDDHYESLGAEERTADVLEEGGFRVRYEYGHGRPTCEKCQANYPVDRLVDEECDFACVECGDPASTSPTPSWLRAALPTARQIYSVDPGLGDPGSSALELESHKKAIKPIAMSCPSCAGGLKITTESTRILACKFCQSDIYLPDAVWRRLHPIKMVQPFFIRFEGISHAQRREVERREQAKRDAELAAAYERDRAAERAKEVALLAEMAKEEEREVARLKARAWTASKRAVALLLVWVAWVYSAGDLFSIEVWGDSGFPITLGLGALAVAFTLFAMHRVGQPVAQATGYGFEWILFITWFWIPFSCMPGIGALLAFWRSIALYRGKFAASTIESNGSRSSYDAVSLEAGEGRPGALLFLAIAALNVALWSGVFSSGA